MFITLLEITFDITYFIISKTASGIYHGSKYLLSSNTEKDHDSKADLLQEIKKLKQSNEELKSELESMKITVDELNSKVNT